MLDLPLPTLEDTFGDHFWPDRAKLVELPPKDPVIYRLYEIVQVYGHAYKAIIAEKFGDGIMSAITFSTKVEREEDDKGVWVKVSSPVDFVCSLGDNSTREMASIHEVLGILNICLTYM